MFRHHGQSSSESSQTCSKFGWTIENYLMTDCYFWYWLEVVGGVVWRGRSAERGLVDSVRSDCQCFQLPPWLCPAHKLLLLLTHVYGSQMLVEMISGIQCLLCQELSTHEGWLLWSLKQLETAHNHSCFVLWKKKSRFTTIKRQREILINFKKLRPLEPNEQSRFFSVFFCKWMQTLVLTFNLVFYLTFCSHQRCRQFICAFALLSVPSRNPHILSKFQS